MGMTWKGAILSTEWMYCSKPPLLSLQEFRQKSLDWEKQRLRYQQQVASLEAQRKALAEQSELIQVQLICAESFFLFFFVCGSRWESREEGRGRD